MVSELAAPVAKADADADAAVAVPVLEPVAEADADVGAAVDAVRATLATEAADEEAAARRLGGVSKGLELMSGERVTYGCAAVQYWVTWFWTGGFSLLSGQLL